VFSDNIVLIWPRKSNPFFAPQLNKHSDQWL
jgi:hypothetical protein